MFGKIIGIIMKELVDFTMAITTLETYTGWLKI